MQVDAVEPFQVEQRRVLLRAVDSCGRRRGRPVNPVDLHKRVAQLSQGSARCEVQRRPNCFDSDCAHCSQNLWLLVPSLERVADLAEISVILKPGWPNWRLSALPGVFGDERRQAPHNHAAHRRIATIRLNNLAPPAYRYPTVRTSGMLSCCAARCESRRRCTVSTVGLPRHLRIRRWHLHVPSSTYACGYIVRTTSPYDATATPLAPTHDRAQLDSYQLPRDGDRNVGARARCEPYSMCMDDKHGLHWFFL